MNSNKSFCFFFKILEVLDKAFQATIEYSASIEETAKKFFKDVMNKKVSYGESDVIPQKKLRPETSLPKTSLPKLQKKNAGKRYFA